MDDEQTRKDTAYSPASERETAEKQADTRGETTLPPGTGGPDDSGDEPLVHPTPDPDVES
jgi:hypothetical protein